MTSDHKIDRLFEQVLVPLADRGGERWLPFAAQPAQGSFLREPYRRSLTAAELVATGSRDELEELREMWEREAPALLVLLPQLAEVRAELEREHLADAAADAPRSDLVYPMW